MMINFSANHGGHRRQEAAERRQERDVRKKNVGENHNGERNFSSCWQLSHSSRTSPLNLLQRHPPPPCPLHMCNRSHLGCYTLPIKGQSYIPHPLLQSDVTFLGYKTWNRQWKDYATFTDLGNLDHPKQHIQLCICLTHEVLHILQYRLCVSPDDTRPIGQVLNALEQHVKAQTNEALRRRDLLSRKQQVEECFNDFFVRVKNLAEAVDICKGANTQCEETQLKQVLLIGVCNQDFLRELISTTKTLD
ncbi:hypothetical protein E2C01_036571 [Portunus trituberculatus]|uniref:Uncharacterized protein n=1 Tax=Portunus trituberculatus TaxID=210409 RepID=A0A5B7FBI6_PORTR|nr:hypothetical protein [Portunus trituberculatus]